MKSTAWIVAAFCISATALASGHALAGTPPAMYMTVEGEVVRYEKGSVIVLRGEDNKEATYTLAPTIVMPSDVAVGRRVTLFTEPGKDGKTQLVSRVTTTSITPAGDVKRTTEETRTLPSGETTRTTTTDVSGTVKAYDAGKTVTITRADGTHITYLLNDKSQVPEGLVIGKTITVLPWATTKTGDPVARTITYTTTTTTETVPKL